MGRKALWDESWNSKIIKMFWEQNMSLNEISKQTGIHPQSIKRRLNKLGFKTRNLSQAMTNFWRKHGNRKN